MIDDEPIEDGDLPYDATLTFGYRLLDEDPADPVVVARPIPGGWCLRCSVCHTEWPISPKGTLDDLRAVTLGHLDGHGVR